MQKGLVTQDAGLRALAPLAARIAQHRAIKKDYIADTRRVHMEEGATGLVLEDHGRFEIAPLAHTQLGERLQVPAKFYTRLREEHPGLLAQTVNTLLAAKPEKRMIRTLGPRARSVLSNSYQRIDNHEVANATLPILADLPGIHIPTAEITDHRMYIQAVVPGVQADIKVGDTVQAGVLISNSEVGLGSVSVSALIWRLRCLNGLKTVDTLRAFHIGRRVEDNESLWADDTKKSDDRTVLLKVRDMVRAAVDAVKFQERVQRMRDLADQRVTGDPAKAIEVLVDKLDVSEEEGGGIMRALIEGGDLSAWGLINAVTFQAHEAPSYDRAVEFEAMGGRLLNLNPREWKEVLEAH